MNPGCSQRAGLSRRGWMTAAAAALAVSCTPEGIETKDQARTGKARAAATGSPLLPSAERFAAWNEELRRERPGREVSLVDLDAVDHNADVIKAHLGPQLSLRIVTKSLPSLDLIEHLMHRTGTRRLMAFSEGLLWALLDRFGAEPGGVDILLGRPMPVEGAGRVLRAFRRAEDVRWLVDTEERALEYQALAEELGRTLEVVLEIDVGLRRGGARTASELREMLDVVGARASRLRFGGLMGYEGHVPFAPPGFDSDAEFTAVMERYADFVSVLESSHPQLLDTNRPLVWNGGGSGTLHYYGAGLETPVDDVAIGSAFLLPADFVDIARLRLRPAAFLATPILKRIDPAEVPFAPGYLPMLAQSDPSLEVAFFMLTGNFPGSIVSPEGLVPSPLIPGGTEVKSLLTNQTLRNGPSSLDARPGDFVFHHVWEGSGISWLDTVDVLQDDRIAGCWRTFQEGRQLACGGFRA